MTTDAAIDAPVLPKPADFGNRFTAFAIDTALLLVLQWLPIIVLSRQLQAVGLTETEACAADAGASQLCEGPSDALWALLFVLLVMTTIGYHAVFEGRQGATPGKRWMGLEVVGADGAVPIGLQRATLRSLVRQSFWIVLFLFVEPSPLAVGAPAALYVVVPLLALAGLTLGAFRLDGRSLHDLAADTVVAPAGASA